MSSIPLTLAEAVPLGTVLLQRLLDDAGVRSLVIKGPAFVELGVRKPKQSNDVDLLIHPNDRRRARRALALAGWSQLSFDLPPELEAYAHSRTFQHHVMPCGLDLHHRVPGVFEDAGIAFETLWATKIEVKLAHETVVVPAVSHCLLIEALNRFRDTPISLWTDRADEVTLNSRPSGIGLEQVVHSAQELEAELTVAPLIAALGGDPRQDPSDERYLLWCRRAGHEWLPHPLLTLARVAPWRLPHFLVRQAWIPESQARHWAEKKGIAYRSRGHIALLRMLRLARKG